MDEAEDRMTIDEMQRFLILEVDRGSSELEECRSLMYVLGVEFEPKSAEVDSRKVNES